MSAFAGLVSFAGRPIDLHDVARMIEPLQPCARLDIQDPLVYEGAALAFCGRRSRRAASDCLLADPGVRCAIVFDGRIDNRQEVAAWLGLDRRPPLSDARLVLAGYASRGTDLLSRLYGDFAFAVWDARARRLLLASDPLGVRQACWAPAGECVAFATDPRQLLDVAGVDRRPNLGFFAEWMAGCMTHVSDTVYQGIHRVPAAHFVTASSGAVSVQRYWDVDPGRQLRYADAAEYAWHFRELFASSVRSRVESADTVAVALSGGIDSSAITAMAAAVSAECATDIRAYHVSYPGPEANEEGYARIVAEAHRLPLRVIPCAGQQADEYLRIPRLLRDITPGGVGAAELPFFEAMAEEGCELVLDGNGADEWFGGTYYHAADLLRAGRPVAAFRRLLEHATHSGSIHSVGTLAKGAVWAALPPAVRRTIKHVLPARNLVPRLFRREFAAAVNLVDRITQPNYDDRFPTFAAGAVYRDATCQVSTCGWHEDVRLASAFGLEMSAPFHDRAIAEFAVGLPEEQRWSGGRAKRIVRNALRDLMPPRILDRDDKGNGSDAQFVELVRLRRQGAFEHLHLVDAGFVEKAAIEPMFRGMCEMQSRGDRHYEIEASRLWLLFCGECVWRALFVEDRAAADPPRPVLERTGAL